jgi:DNA-binding transcriptional regulator YbjK
MTARFPSRERALRIYLDHSLACAQVALYAAEKSKRHELFKRERLDKAIAVAKKVIAVLNECLCNETRGTLLSHGIGYLIALDRYQDAFLCARNLAWNEGHRDFNTECLYSLQCDLFSISGQAFINASISRLIEEPALCSVWEFAAKLADSVVTSTAISQSTRELCTSYKEASLVKLYEEQAKTAGTAQEARYFRLASVLECRAWACNLIHSILNAYQSMFPWNAPTMMELYGAQYTQAKNDADLADMAASCAKTLGQEAHPVARQMLSEALRVLDDGLQQYDCSTASEAPLATSPVLANLHWREVAIALVDTGIGLSIAFQAKNDALVECKSAPPVAMAAMQALEERLLVATRAMAEIIPAEGCEEELEIWGAVLRSYRQAFTVDLPRLLFYLEQAEVARSRTGSIACPQIAASWDKAAAHMVEVLRLSGEGTSGVGKRQRIHRACCHAYIRLARVIYPAAAQNVRTVAQLPVGRIAEGYSQAVVFWNRAAEFTEAAIADFAEQDSSDTFCAPDDVNSNISFANSLERVLTNWLRHQSSSPGAEKQLSIAACAAQLPQFITESEYSLTSRAEEQHQLVDEVGQLALEAAELLNATLRVPSSAPLISNASLYDARGNEAHVAACLWLGGASEELSYQSMRLDSKQRLDELRTVLSLCVSVLRKHAQAPQPPAPGGADLMDAPTQVDPDEDEFSLSAAKAYRTQRRVDHLLLAGKAADSRQAALLRAAATALDISGGNLDYFLALCEISQESVDAEDEKDVGASAPRTIPRTLSAAANDAAIYISDEIYTRACRVTEPRYLSPAAPLRYPRFIAKVRVALDKVVEDCVATALNSAIGEDKQAVVERDPSSNRVGSPGDKFVEEGREE